MRLSLQLCLHTYATAAVDLRSSKSARRPNFPKKKGSHFEVLKCLFRERAANCLIRSRFELRHLGWQAWCLEGEGKVFSVQNCRVAKKNCQTLTSHKKKLEVTNNNSVSLQDDF